MRGRGKEPRRQSLTSSFPTSTPCCPQGSNLVSPPIKHLRLHARKQQQQQQQCTSLTPAPKHSIPNSLLTNDCLQNKHGCDLVGVVEQLEHVGQLQERMHLLVTQQSPLCHWVGVKVQERCEIAQGIVDCLGCIPCEPNRPEWGARNRKGRPQNIEWWKWGWTTALDFSRVNKTRSL